MGDRPHILVIDDEKDLTEMIAFQFKTKGYNVTTASNGVEGLEKLAGIDPHLIILDLNMPKMGGIEFYQNICTQDGRPSHPVMILTARANTEQLFKDFDIDGFMAKPFDINDLIREAEMIITKRARSSQTNKRTQKIKVVSVYVADNDVEALDAISLELLRAGYLVACAKSGTSALELISLAPPTLAVVSLALTDIAGDVVAQRGLRMAKTSDVKFLLYEKRDIRHAKAIRQNIGDKTGIVELVEYDNAKDLVKAVDAAIQKGEIEDKESEVEDI